MAGLFGMFDQTKPGPGVSKNAPKKKPFFQFWELYTRKFWKLMVANFLYVLLSLPIVTSGLAQAGLTFVTRNYVREKHVFLPSDFFDTIKKNWKQALTVGLLELVLGGLLAYSLYFYWTGMATGGSSLLSTISVVLALFIVMLFCFARYYVYLQLITFKMSLKQIIKNSLLFAVAGVKQNLLITAILLALYALAAWLLLTFFWVMLVILIVVYVCVFPAFRSFLIQFTVFPLVKQHIIDPYYREHPEEDIDKRKDLNLENIPEPVAEESVFADPEHHDPEPSAIPRQYSQDEQRRARRLRRRESQNADDDGTI